MQLRQGCRRKSWNVTQVPLCRFRMGHPARVAVSAPIRAIDHQNRLAPMRSMAQLYSTLTAERVKAVVNLDCFAHNVAFVRWSTRPLATHTCRTSRSGKPLNGSPSASPPIYCRRFNSGHVGCGGRTGCTVSRIPSSAILHTLGITTWRNRPYHSRGRVAAPSAIVLLTNRLRVSAVVLGFLTRGRDSR